MVEPLLLGLQRNCWKQVRRVLEADPEAAKLPFLEQRFEWPLCAAIRLGCSEEIVRLLTENGAEADVTNGMGLSPLQVLSSGAHAILAAPPLDLRAAPGTAEWTARMRELAAERELGVATALLRAGADPEASYGGPGRGHPSSLELARRAGKDHLVGLFETLGHVHTV